MPDTPLNPDALEAAENMFIFMCADGYTPKAEDAAQSLVSAYLAVAQPEVNSVEELDALPAGSIILHDEGFTVLPARRSFADGEWYVTGSNEYRRAETLLPATVLYRPEVDDA